MKLELKGRTIILPDVIYLDQLAQLDLSIMTKFENFKEEDLSKSTELIQWLVHFFKVLDVKERFTVADLLEFQKEDRLINWFRDLFAGFQPSN